MFSGFQSSGFQTGFQIVRGGIVPPPAEVDTHDGYTDYDIKRWKKYLRDLKAFKEKQALPKKKRKKRSRSIKEVIEFDASKFQTVKSLDSEILLIEGLIKARRLELIERAEQDEKEYFQIAAMLLL